MNFFLTNQFMYNKNYLFLSTLLTFLIIAFYHLSSGLIMSPDSYAYSRWADDLIKLNFNLFDYYVQSTFIVSPYFYTAPVLIVALLKVIFGSEWQNAFLILNLILVLCSLIIFAKSLLILRVAPFLIILAMPILIVSVDLLLWPRYILSDMNFAFLVIFVTYMVIKGIVRNKFNYLTLLFAMFLIFISRPASLPIIFAIVAFIIILRFNISNTPKIILLITLISLFITPLIFSTIYYLVELNGYENPQLIRIFSWIKAGMISNNRPETSVGPPSTFIDVAYIYFLRFINFFNPYAISFSKIHIILNLFQTLLILSSIVVWYFFNSNKLFDRTFLFILLLSFSVAAFHSFTIIDYDWRYRFPIILPLIMLFPIAMEMILKKIRSKQV